MKRILIILTAICILSYPTYKGIEYYLKQQLLETIFQPCEVTIDRKHLHINKGFPDIIAIQEIIPTSLDSLGIPKTYKVTKISNCRINNKDNETVFNFINSIYFTNPGDYRWNLTKYSTPFPQETKLYGNDDSQNLKICPITFEKSKWYYIVINNFDIDGIFINANKEGDFISEIIKNGISPI